MSEVTMVAVDGREALFALMFKPAGDSVQAEMFGNGLSRAEVVVLLRQVADHLEAQG